MTSRVACALAFALATLTGCQRPPETILAAATFDVEVRVLPNGSAEVLERITARFQSAATGFERVIAYDTADGVTFTSASLDGRELNQDTPGGVEVDEDDGRRLRVRWTFPPASVASRTFVLRYVVAAAAAIEGMRGSLRLAVIPANRTYPIELARISLTLPEAAALFSGSGIAEAGWQVERRANGIHAERRDLPATEAGTMVAEFSVDPTTVVEPRWQMNQRWGQFLMPAFVSGGLFILIIGAGVLWIIRFQYPRTRAGGTDDDRQRELVRAGLRNGGFVVIAVAAGSALAVWLTLSHLGIWPMAIPLSIAIVGLVFVGVSRRFV